MFNNQFVNTVQINDILARRQVAPIAVTLLMVFVISLFVTACVGLGADPSTPTPAPMITLRLSGSGGGATILKHIVESLSITQPNLKLDFLAGSGGRHSKTGVAEGILDIGILLSSDITHEGESGLEILALAQDPLTFVTHPGLVIANLTSGQLNDIYFGRMTNWQEIGGPDATIVVLTRNADEASTIILRDELFGRQPFINSAIILNKAGEMREAVTKIPNSIGFMSYGDLVVRDLKTNPIAIDGVHASGYNRGGYPLSARTLAVVYDPANWAKVQPLIDYLKSESAKNVIRDSQLVIID